jgi:hypothetical protein
VDDKDIGIEDVHTMQWTHMSQQTKDPKLGVVTPLASHSQFSENGDVARSP